MNKIPVSIVLRVSTNAQDTARQLKDLSDYAREKDYQIVGVFEEKVSGIVDESKRGGLNDCIDLAKTGKIKKVLVSEISRIGRKNSVTWRFVEAMQEASVSIFWHAQKMETMLDNGKINPLATMMIAILAEQARNELETMKERVRSAMRLSRERGTVLGRPVGTKIKPKDFIKKHSDIVRQLKAGQSIRNAAKITGKGISTVQRVKELI